MTELHQQLQESIRELEQIRKISEHTAALHSRLAAEMDALATMEKTLEKEQRDVEALERDGLTAMFRKFIGDREEKLEKERQEYIRASLRYNELYKSVELIRYELNLLSQKENREDEVVRKIEVQMKMREEEIMTLDSASGAMLRNIYSQLDRLQKNSVEIEEAFHAGSQAMNLVSQAERCLMDAQTLGQRDMWRGPYYERGYRKHEAIERARELALQSRHALITFGKELTDVFKAAELRINLDIEKFNKFGDIFFDNIFSDYLAQQKINKSLQHVSTSRQEIETWLGLLEQEKRKVNTKRENLGQQRKTIILDSAS